MLATIDLVISVHVILLQYITLPTAIPIELFKMLKRDFRIDLGGIHKPCGHGRGEGGYQLSILLHSPIK